MRRFRFLWAANEAFAPGTARNVVGMDRRPDFIDAAYYEIQHNEAGGFKGFDFYDDDGNVFMQVFWEPFSITDEGEVPPVQLP